MGTSTTSMAVLTSPRLALPPSFGLGNAASSNTPPSLPTTSEVKPVETPVQRAGWKRTVGNLLRPRRGLLVSLALHLAFGLTLTVIAVEHLPHGRPTDLTVLPGGQGEGSGGGDSFGLAAGGLPDGDRRPVGSDSQENGEIAQRSASPLEIQGVVKGLPIGAHQGLASVLEGGNPGQLRGSGGGKGSRGQGGGSGGGFSGGSGGGVGFFGASAAAESCVYVFDMSGSMHGRRFRRALSELNRSISDLKPHQRFFVIMFSDSAVPLFADLSTTELLETFRVELFPATVENKHKARAWLSKLKADGHTHPTTALKLAIDLKPDVIFFLTDGEIPEEVLSEVSAYNQKQVPVHSIEFENLEGAQRLQRLSSQNSGPFRHVK
ncbi:MAG: VWA domain-containing protein [Planctomycetales bacterium]